MSKTPPLRIRHVAIDDLIGADWNPRHMGEMEMEKLVRSLDEFGFVEPIVVNTCTGLVVGGHQRLEAARRLKLAKIPIVEVDLTEDQAKVLNLALNRIHGVWEPDRLAELLAELADDDVTLAGFDDRELGSLEDVYFQAKITREAKPQPPPEDAETEPGDIWTLGEHVLVCGDARLPTSYQAFPDKATCLLTDPPFGMRYASMDGRSWANDEPETTQDLISGMLEAARDHLIDRASFYIFSPHGPQQLQHLLGLSEAPGYQHRATLVWVKDRIALNAMGAEYQYQHEAIHAGQIEGLEVEEDDDKRLHDYSPIIYGSTGPKPYWAGSRGESTALFYERPHASPLHPAERPGPLLERLIRNSTRRGDAILDPFAGSGSIMVAAENRLRIAHMIEIDPAYCDVIVNRYRELTGKKGRRRHDANLGEALAEASRQDPDTSAMAAASDDGSSPPAETTQHVG